MEHKRWGFFLDKDYVYSEKLYWHTLRTDNTVSLYTSIFYSAYSRAAYFTACSCTDILNYILGTHSTAVTPQAAFQMDLYSALGMVDGAT